MLAQASKNDRFVALELLKNANVAAGMVLPGCQDTGEPCAAAAPPARLHRCLAHCPRMACSHLTGVWAAPAAAVAAAEGCWTAGRRHGDRAGQARRARLDGGQRRGDAGQGRVRHLRQAQPALLPGTLLCCATHAALWAALLWLRLSTPVYINTCVRKVFCTSGPIPSRQAYTTRWEVQGCTQKSSRRCSRHDQPVIRTQDLGVGR